MEQRGLKEARALLLRGFARLPAVGGGGRWRAAGNGGEYRGRATERPVVSSEASDEYPGAQAMGCDAFTRVRRLQQRGSANGEATARQSSCTKCQSSSDELKTSFGASVQRLRFRRQFLRKIELRVGFCQHESYTRYLGLQLCYRRFLLILSSFGGK